MKYLFTPAGLAALDRFLQHEVLLAFDYDGTLAPIVQNRYRAKLPRQTEKLFMHLTQIAPCAVLSGRGGGDIADKVRGARLVAVIGNHGIEYARTPGELRDTRRLVNGWVKRLEKELAPVQGVEIENKRLSLSLHYRLAKDPQSAKRAIRAALEGLGRLRIMEGKCLLNALPPKIVHKGTALRALQRNEGFARALYIGDDTTDEDVFDLPPTPRRFTVRVGRRAASRATWYLKEQHEIDRFLEILVRARS